METASGRGRHLVPEFPGFPELRLGSEVALRWDFFRIPFPKPQIPGILDFFSPENPDYTIPKIPGIRFFVEWNFPQKATCEQAFASNF